MVQDVLDSIIPLDQKDKKPKETGTILAVDDNKNNTDLLDKRLTKKGHEVFIANNGKDALLRLSIDRNQIDVILLDIVMPEMNGFEVLKYLKNDKRYFEIPVIMISSMDDTDSIYRCIENGADDYITKPFDKSILDARISSCIEKKHLRDKEKVLMKKLAEEQEKSENLLLNILPEDIAYRLKSGETNIATKHKGVSILFADIVDFTPQSKKLKPNELVVILNKIFSCFDDLSSKFKIEKIKTIGDSYFAVGGLNSESLKSSKNLIEMAKEMITEIDVLNNETEKMDIELRIGIHCGDVVTGVIGKHKFAYDLWGSAVNMASRMESTSLPGKIQVSEEVKSLVADSFKFQKREKIKIKGLGYISTYFIK
ncbi:response regulator [bacterium]|nr:response regulator [bacterium]